MLTSLASLTFLLFPACYCVTVPLHRRDPAHSTTVGFTTSNPSSSDFSFSNVQDIRYTVQIELEGTPYTVILDTGSTDLWLDRPGESVQGLTNTGLTTSIDYVTSAVKGPIVVGEVTLGDFNIPQQALIDSRTVPNPVIGGLAGVQGLMGLLPPINSRINDALSAGNSPYSGASFLDNVFSLYPDDPNILTFLLARNDAGTTSGGAFTIGEIVQDYSDIVNTPQLPVLVPEGGAWQTLMDAVVVNGNQISGNSFVDDQGVTGVPDGKVLIEFDTGTPYATAPPYYVDAMYKTVLGAVYDSTIQGYIVPCDTQLNITLVFGSNEYAINPIDSTHISDVASDGSPICSGSFTYTPTDAGVDFLLGDTFLRNVYSLFDFGEWATTGTTAPFMQILSVTDASQAYAAFNTLNAARIQAYLQTQGATSASQTQSTNSDAASADIEKENLASSDGSSSSNSDDYNTLVRNSYIIMGIAVVAVLLLIGLVIVSASQCRGNRKQGYRQVNLKESFSASIDKPYSTEASYVDDANPYQK